jgi:hypothetical protein
LRCGVVWDRREGWVCAGEGGVQVGEAEGGCGDEAGRVSVVGSDGMGKGAYRRRSEISDVARVFWW